MINLFGAEGSVHLSDPSNIENVQERSMVDIAYDLLENKGESMAFTEIMKLVAQRKGFSESQADEMIAQLFTEINIDGRFVCVGRNLWGLKHWFPLEQSSDSAVAANVKEDDDLAEDVEEYEDGEDELEEDYPEHVFVDEELEDED